MHGDVTEHKQMTHFIGAKWGKNRHTNERVSFKPYGMIEGEPAHPQGKKQSDCFWFSVCYHPIKSLPV